MRLGGWDEKAEDHLAQASLAKLEHRAMAYNALPKGVLCSIAKISALEHNTMPCKCLRSSTLCSNLAN